jgi:hypothetical protein
MVWRTMEEWNKRGKMVKKGEKCLLRDPSGICLFSGEQVTASKPKHYSPKEMPIGHRGTGYFAQHGGNCQKHDYDYDNWEFQ